MGLILRAQIGKNGMSKVFVLASEILLKFGVADQCLSRPIGWFVDFRTSGRRETNTNRDE